VTTFPSVVTSKPANEGHFKTGQRSGRAGQGFLLLQSPLKQ
jgi:hypothetical protein